PGSTVAPPCAWRMMPQSANADAELLARFRGGCPPGYATRFSPATAVADLHFLQGLSADNPLAMSFYQREGGKDTELHCKLYHFGGSLPLSDVMPVLDNLGLRVLGE